MRIKRGKENVVLILGIIFLIIGGILLYFVLVHEGYKNMPVTPIANAKDGESMKIHGVITASQNNRDEVIWVVYKYENVEDSEEKTAYHYYVDYFWVEDGTGTIKVRMRYSGANHHFATEKQYNVGSGITIVGKIDRRGNETTIKAEAIGPKPDSFGAPLWIKAFAALMLFGGVFFEFMYIRQRFFPKRKRTVTYGDISIEISEDILDESEYYED